MFKVTLSEQHNNNNYLSLLDRLYNNNKDLIDSQEKHINITITILQLVNIQKKKKIL